MTYTAEHLAGTYFPILSRVPNASIGYRYGASLVKTINDRIVEDCYLYWTQPDGFLHCAQWAAATKELPLAF